MKKLITVFYLLFVVLFIQAQKRIDQVKFKNGQLEEVDSSSLDAVQELMVAMTQKSNKSFRPIKLRIDENNRVFKLIGTKDVVQVTLLANDTLIKDWERVSLSFVETFTPIEAGKQERYVERVDTEGYKSIVFFTKDQKLGLSSFMLYRSMINDRVFFISCISDSPDEIKIDNMKRVASSLQVDFPLFGLSQSKDIRIESGRHLKPAGLNKFFGTWVYENQDDVFILVLKKHEYYNKNSGNKMDFLVGYHSYKKNGVMIDGYDVAGTNTIMTGVFDKKVNDENILSFRFRESKCFVNAQGTLTYVKGNPDKLIFKLVLTEGGGMINLDGKNNEYKLHVPDSIELKRGF